MASATAAAVAALRRGGARTVTTGLLPAAPVAVARWRRPHAVLTSAPEFCEPSRQWSHQRCAASSSSSSTARAGSSPLATDAAAPTVSQRKRLQVECIASAERAKEVTKELLQLALPRQNSPLWPLCAAEAPAIGFDAEGVRLGRFGRLCVVQLATEDGRVFVLDALRPGVVESLKPLLESQDIVKVAHDCREDSAALFHQHDVHLQAVFDTQAAETMLLRHCGKTPVQVSFAASLRNRLEVQEFERNGEVKDLMVADAMLWSRRPLSALLLRYAIHGIDHLRRLRSVLLEEASALGGAALLEDVAAASQKATDYCLMNKEFPTPQSMAKIGTRLWAYVAARTPAGIFFKLNGSRVGLASTGSAISRFSDIQVGDAVLCCVSGVSINGTYLYLDRYDPDWDYFDHQLRPGEAREVGEYGREHRHQPGLCEDDVDPLLVRGLPAELVKNALDPWEAGHEDLGLPLELDDL